MVYERPSGFWIKFDPKQMSRIHDDSMLPKMIFYPPPDTNPNNLQELSIDMYSIIYGTWLESRGEHCVLDSRLYKVIQLKIMN